MQYLVQNKEFHTKNKKPIIHFMLLPNRRRIITFRVFASNSHGRHAVRVLPDGTIKLPQYLKVLPIGNTLLWKLTRANGKNVALVSIPSWYGKHAISRVEIDHNVLVTKIPQNFIELLGIHAHTRLSWAKLQDGTWVVAKTLKNHVAKSYGLSLSGTIKLPQEFVKDTGLQINDTIEWSTSDYNGKPAAILRKRGDDNG
jgi:hypothetical protein